MRTRFYIEKRNDESGKLMIKERPVFMSVSFSGNRLILGTGIKVDLNGWDTERQKVKSIYPDSHSSNAWLEALINTAVSALKAIQNSNTELNSQQFRRVFNELKPKFSSGFFDVFYLFMENSSKRWSVSTYRKVRTIYKHLREFEDHSGYRISFQSVDATFLEKFTVFYSERGNSKSTTHKAINILVWFLNWATDNGYNVYRAYRKFYKAMGPAMESSRSPLYLRWDELMLMRAFVTTNRRMERVRDMFCFMCFSGVRYSELQSLRKEDVGAHEIIIRKKSGNLRRLPLNKYAREIHMAYENKYYLNNSAFPSMSIITMNKYLRIIGKEAGLDREVSTIKGEGSRISVSERLTAGIAVNTFIANAFLRFNAG